MQTCTVPLVLNTIQQCICASTEFDFIYWPFYYTVMLWLRWRKEKKIHKGISINFSKCVSLFLSTERTRMGQGVRWGRFKTTFEDEWGHTVRWRIHTVRQGTLKTCWCCISDVTMNCLQSVTSRGEDSCGNKTTGTGESRIREHISH